MRSAKLCLLIPAFLSLGLLAACNYSEDSTTGDSSPPGDSEQPDDTDDTGDQTCDTGDSPDPDADQISDMTWRQHDEIESLVYVGWTQASTATTYVEYLFEGEEWSRSPELEREAGEQEQILVGIPYDTSFNFRVVSESDDESFTSEECDAETGEIPVEGLGPEVLVSDETQWEPTGNYMIGSINATRSGWTSGDFWMFILDRQGRVVWAYLAPDENFCYYVRESLDGKDILWDEITYWTSYDYGAASKVYRMKLDGSISESYPIPGANHAFTEMPDGSIVWYGMDSSGNGQLLKYKPDGTQETLWDCDEFYASMGINENCLQNTVFWHEPADSFLLSFALEDFALELDHQTGTVLRLWGHLDGAWDFDPEDSAFWTQHGISYTDTGTLLMSTHVSSSSTEVVVREYELDDQAQVLREVWNYGIGEGVEASLGGEAHRLPGGNTLHNYGLTPRLKEVTPDGEVVWDLDWTLDGMIGRTTFIEDLYALVP